MRCDILNPQTVSLSDDTVAIRDKTDEKSMLKFSITNSVIQVSKEIVYELEAARIGQQ